MNCPKCHKENTPDSKFCADCGTILETEKKSSRKKTPADQAAQMAKEFKGVWGKLSLSEKILAVGALVSLISFFLPWAVGSSLEEFIELSGGRVGYLNGIEAGKISGWFYLHPLLMLASLAMVYFTQGASKTTKILMARWQIIIGTIFSFLGVWGIIAAANFIRFMNEMASSYGSYYGGSDVDIGIGIGWWLLTLGALGVLVGALKIQQELVK